MQIQKVEKLNYARFHNFSWGPTLDPFCNGVNVFFGWNGSGKTTFSKVMRDLEIGSVKPNCTFKIKTDSSQITEVSNMASASGNIRVFNSTYIEDTLRGSFTIPYIFFVGKEAIDYTEDERKLKDKREELSKITLPTNRDDIAKQTALLVKSVTGVNSFKKELTGAGTYASYDKTDFEKRIADIDKKIANEKITTSSDLMRADIDELKNQLVNTERSSKIDKEITTAAQWILDNVDGINAILECQPIQIQSQRIEDLKEKQTAWVREGVNLHFDSENPISKCLFCDSEIKNVDELVKHFSQAVVGATNTVDGYIKQIEGYTTGFARIDSPTQVQKQNTESLRSTFDSLTLILQEKRNAISSKKKTITIDTTKIQSMTTIVPVDATSVAYAIETHYVAERYDAYAIAKREYDKIVAQRQAIETEISKLDIHVKTLKQKVKNTHEPAKALNRLFKTVFPYRKIEITDSNDGKSYMLKRDNDDCSFSSLSEGEKNFIALAYFIYSVNDVQNKLPEDGVVVIDDPVSSLDKQSIFQIFSIIVNEIKNHTERQYLVLTHNLDFLGHLKEHFRSKIKSGDARLFSFMATNNGCVIEAIHPLLRNHRSDYYYVFSVLAKYKNTCDLEDAHLVVNLLRRWLETFLEFKFSTTGDLRSILESAYSSATKSTKKEDDPFNANPLEMYRFINHGSHGFSDLESIDDSILTNANQRIQEAFQLVRILDPLHYKKLCGILKK